MAEFQNQPKYTDCDHSIYLFSKMNLAYCGWDMDEWDLEILSFFIRVVGKAYKDASQALDWGKPLLSQHRGLLENVLAHTKKTAERSRRFLDKIESKKQSSINRAKSIPRNATIRQEYIKCGKTTCYHVKHGPYYYVYWKDPETKRLKKKYIGQYLQSSSEE